MGTKMTAAGTDAHVSHKEQHMMEGDRRHLLSGPAISGGSSSTELRAEKLSDAALSTQEAIMKASNRGRWVADGMRKGIACSTAHACLSQPTFIKGGLYCFQMVLF